MKTLPLNLDQFGFVEREKVNGKKVVFRCSRDFLYYGLHYYLPEKFNPGALTPQLIEEKRLFGLKLPFWFMWTQLQFIYLPKYLRENGLELCINKKRIDSFLDLVSAILFSRIALDEAIGCVEKAVDEAGVIGIDIALKFGGLLDHVIFVYGYDSDSLYVCDTNQVPNLEYSKVLDDNRFLMKLPRNVVNKRWKRFSRIWELKKKAPQIAILN
jgi:hypothetical protein